MSSLNQIVQDIEQIRSALNQMVGARNGDINHPDVTALSARLDQLIVSHEKTMSGRDKKREVL
ncbi:MAG: aspartyl-phosphate phosphatase Spo0E family protein [Negativicutes bacterium]|nr:aspartyl-phosphate phosphatase Spo0E family protein [Negativicutes bacterium]